LWGDVKDVCAIISFYLQQALLKTCSAIIITCGNQNLTVTNQNSLQF